MNKSDYTPTQYAQKKDSDTVYITQEVESLLRLKALNLVSAERDRQIALWGNVYFKNYLHAICVLGEEYGELCEAVNETVNEIKRPELGGKENMIKEATQVAAVAIKFIQMLLAEE